MPKSRLGEAWLFRKNFDAAAKLKVSQDNWCFTASRLNYNEEMSSPFPEDLRYESLVALLRGDVRLNVHCYEVGHLLDQLSQYENLHWVFFLLRFPDFVDYGSRSHDPSFVRI